MKLRTNTKAKRRTQGFTLLEIMIALAIIIMVSSVSIYAGSKMLRRGRVTSVVDAISNVRNAISDYVTKPGSLGTMPLTEGTTYTTGMVSGTTNYAALSKAVTLDQMLQAEGLFEKPFTVSMGPQSNTPTGTVAATWSTANQRWECTADPSVDKSNIARVECAVNTATTDPVTSAGTCYLLDGVNKTPTYVRVAYLVIPNVPVEDAYQLSLSVDKATLSNASLTASDTMGAIAYTAPVGGLVTVYCYVTQI